MDDGDNQIKERRRGAKYGVNKRAYHGGYANLAAAIINSGIRANDTRFLESEWYETLADICALDAELYDTGGPTEIHSLSNINNGGYK